MNWFQRLPRWLSWGLALPLIALNGWTLFQLLTYFEFLATVFLSAMLLAFVLNYPVGWLQNLKFPRFFAVLAVIVLSLALLILLGVTLIPILVEQLYELKARLPTWLQSGMDQFQVWEDWIDLSSLPIDSSRLMAQIENRISTQLQIWSGQALSIILNAISSVFNLLLTLVLTFYLLLHGNRLWAGIFKWFPSPLDIRIREVLRENFQNYFIGQISLATLKGTALTVAFLILQVPFGLLFGIGIGFLAIFPLGGTLGITVVSFLIGLKSIWLGVKVLLVAVVVDQIIENAVAPQLMGEFTGLNPVLVPISLIIGAQLGGLLGLVIAVPVASFLKSMFETLRSRPFDPDTQTDPAEAMPV